ncbi:MAG TPA: J domain-containing protein [Deltaproteobacteria bacterium]|nr:J domain-containing protein [Deltaproteobacteria bacterium]
MKRYQEIDAARTILELPESATMKEIKASYRRLIRRWHPDRCGDNADQCVEMTRKLIAAYETILTYCKHYRYAFAEEEVKKYGSGEDWWMDRFGNDPLWGNLKERT